MWEPQFALCLYCGCHWLVIPMYLTQPNHPLKQHVSGEDKNTTIDGEPRNVQIAVMIPTALKTLCRLGPGAGTGAKKNLQTQPVQASGTIDDKQGTSGSAIYHERYHPAVT
jgi:hypothetical protein